MLNLQFIEFHLYDLLNVYDVFLVMTFLRELPMETPFVMTFTNGTDVPIAMTFPSLRLK